MTDLKTFLTKLGLAALTASIPAVSHAGEPDEPPIALTRQTETTSEPASIEFLSLDTSRVLLGDIKGTAIQPLKPKTADRKFKVVNMDGFLKTKVKLGSISNGENIYEMTTKRQGRGLYPRTRYTEPLTPQAGLAVFKSF